MKRKQENKNKMYCIIYRIRKMGGVNIDTRKRTIFYEYQNDEEKAKMDLMPVLRLCKEFGFVRQAVIV